jgi:hypothetical protein
MSNGSPVRSAATSVVERNELRGAVARHGDRVHRKAESLERLEERALRFGPRPPLRLADAVGKKLQRPPCRHRRIDLAHGAGGRVARIDERLETGCLLPRVQRVEIAPRHVNLAAHFEDGGDARAAQPLWYRADGLDVGRHVLADFAVAAGRCNGEPTRFVAKADGKAVELVFRHVLDRRRIDAEPEIAANARVELGRRSRSRVGLGPDRQHRNRVTHRGEIRPARASPRAAWGESGVKDRRVFGLDRLQLAKERVVLGVRDRRRIEHVVALVVLGDRAVATTRRAATIAAGAS